MSQQVKIYRALEFYPDGGGAVSCKITPSADGIDIGVDDTGYDVKFFGDTASAYMLWDASDDALEFGGASALTMGTSSKLVIPVKASGSTTAGDLWLDTTDDKLHFYDGSAERTVTST